MAEHPFDLVGAELEAYITKLRARLLYHAKK